MSAFRLLLCLTGLAIYFVFKQFILAHPGDSRPSLNPAPSTRSVSPEADNPADVPGDPATRRQAKPQTTPHSEVLKSQRGLVMVEPNR